MNWLLWKMAYCNLHAVYLTDRYWNWATGSNFDSRPVWAVPKSNLQCNLLWRCTWSWSMATIIVAILAVSIVVRYLLYKPMYWIANSNIGRCGCPVFRAASKPFRAASKPFRAASKPFRVAWSFAPKAWQKFEDAKQSHCKLVYNPEVKK